VNNRGPDLHREEKIKDGLWNQIEIQSR